MQLSLVGLSHKTAPIEVRERLYRGPDKTKETLLFLSERFRLEEGMILSTCNRIEVLGFGQTQPKAQIREFFYSTSDLGPSQLDPCLYEFGEEKLIQHVFRVASSLDSMVLGEPQILGQMKRAFEEACLAGTAGTHLKHLIPRAFFVAKRVRSETRIAQSAVSVSSVAVELARKIFGSLEDRVVLLIGAGEMSELAAQCLMETGVSKIVVTNRTPAKAKTLAKTFHGEAISFEGFLSAVPQVDIVIASAAGGDGHLLNQNQVARALQNRRQNPLFIIDIGVPRCVDSKVNELEDVFLYDIDDLQSVIDANLRERLKATDVAEQIVAQEARQYWNHSQATDLNDLIPEVIRSFEEICLECLEREPAESRSPNSERLLRRAAHRLAHSFVSELKEGSRLDRANLPEINFLRRVLERSRRK